MITLPNGKRWMQFLGNISCAVFGSCFPLVRGSRACVTESPVETFQRALQKAFRVVAACPRTSVRTRAPTHKRTSSPAALTLHLPHGSTCVCKRGSSSRSGEPWEQLLTAFAGAGAAPASPPHTSLRTLQFPDGLVYHL